MVRYIALALVLFLDIAAFDFTTAIYASYHSIGLGTLVTTLINSYLIKFSGKIIERFFNPDALIPPLQRFLSLS
jgi:hypothetical protein